MAKKKANGKNAKGTPTPTTNTPQQAGTDGEDAVTGNDASKASEPEQARTAPGAQGEKQELADAIRRMGDNSAAVVPEGIDAQPLGNERPAFMVRTKARNGRRRRAGMAFSGEPYGIDLDALTDDQIAAIKADSMLVVEECTYPVDEESD